MVREVIQEDTVRQLFLKRGETEIHVSRDAYVTDQARSYIRENGIRLIVDGVPPASTGTARPAGGALPENNAIRPAKEMAQGRFVTLDGRRLSEKPEHMTHLHANVLVPKTHPRIALRGRLDDLEADILNVQLRALEEGNGKLVDALQQTLDFARKILGAEVAEKPLEDTELLGMDEAAQRRVSHNPKKYLGIGHLMPDVHMGALALGLNKLRTETREVELACVAAFERPDGSSERTDLVRALNRLSSTFYIMMLGVIAERTAKES